jgi:SAM-dependent methyltransferase
MRPTEPNSIAVGSFYDRHADAFSHIYGDVLQAFRMTDVDSLLAHEAKAMGITNGMRILDAGCGICGPAIYFAQHYGLHIDAITASVVQARTATEKVSAAGLSDKIFVRHADYHFLEHYYPGGLYDIIYFLESFGHSGDMERAIDSAWNCLKPGGRLYIKDLFVKEAVLPAHAEPIRQNVQRINDAYCYAVCDLYDVLRMLRRKGFSLSFLRTFDIPIEIFQAMWVVNEFQQLTGVNPIDDLISYVFPIDFFELLCTKPSNEPPPDSTGELLQGLYNAHIRGLSPND